MLDWDLYAARLQQNGLSPRDRIIERQRAALQKHFQIAPANKTVMVDDEQKHMLIASSNAMNQKTFVLCPGENIGIGDIVVWRNLHWLVIERDFDDEIAVKGTIVQCNRQIRWQNQDTKQIVERWCLMTKPYTSNVTDGTQISVSNREYKVQLPYDDETRLIDLDRRFMLEVIDGRPRTYSCTSVDQQTNVYQDLDNGFIIWNLSQDDACQPGDNVELMICNYEDPGTDIIPDSIFTIIGPDFLRASLGGFSYAISPSQNNKDCSWEISAQEEIGSHIQIQSSDNKSILIAAEQEAVGSVFELHYVDPSGEILASKAIEVMDIYG